MAFSPDIHHRRSIRLREYDYRSSGAYFVTICTFQRDGRQIAKLRMRYDAETSARRSSAPHSASILENKERE